MKELFKKDRFYSDKELIEQELTNMKEINGVFTEFQANQFLFLFEKQRERLKNTFKYRLISQYKIDKT
jgi:hypothetical protein